MKKSILSILPMALLASCSSELTEKADIVVNSDNVEAVSIQSHPFVFDDDTRTSLTATDNGISFAWANYDALGVFPISPTTNSQAKQDIKLPADCEPKDAHFASFDGAGWELKSGNTYAAYSPYNGTLPSSTSYTAVPIDLNGQDGTLATIGQKYDFMYAPSSFAEVTNGGHIHEVVFDFQHAISIIQFKLTMPVAATWKSLTIANAAGDKVWITDATMNVSTGAVASTATAASINLALSNVTSTVGQEVTLYAAVLPTTTGALSLTATTSDGKHYKTSLASKTLVAGNAYRYTATLAEPTPTEVTWSESDLGGSSNRSYTKDGVTLTPSNGDAHLATNFYDYGSNTFTTTLGNFSKVEIVCTYCRGIGGWSQEKVGSYQPYPDFDPDEWEDIYKLTWEGDAESITIDTDVYGIQSIKFTIK